MNKKPTSLVLSILALQVLMWIQLVFFAVMLALYLYAFGTDSSFGYVEAFVLLDLVFAVLCYFMAKALEKGKKWARVSTGVLGILLLIGFPVGTAIGILFIYGMTKGWPEQVISSN